MKSVHHPTERVLLILETIANVGEITLTELALKTNIPKGTIFPILKSLQSRKYINHNTSGGIYTPGLSCLVLASTLAEKELWLKIINAEMHSIVRECNEVCQLGILDNEWVLYIDKVQGDRAVQLNSKIGTRLPAIYSALGKALLQSQNDSQIMAFYPQGFPPSTDRSVKNIKQLRQQLLQISANGYATDDRETNDETTCFAVPLCQKGRVLAALSVSLPTFRATDEKKSQVIDSIKRAKARIEQTLDKLPDIHHD